MTWVDLVVFGFLAVSGLLAFARGFVREVLGIGAWVGAVAVAILALPTMRGIVRVRGSRSPNGSIRSVSSSHSWAA